MLKEVSCHNGKCWEVNENKEKRIGKREVKGYSKGFLNREIVEGNEYKRIIKSKRVIKT